ncbi:hypothetical protein [Cellulomonas fimi]|uniref:hypothetical protein n=1 Tax=Cellulomonas fimi TaxID=1708 RepID=UPI00201279E5|nr:hypothetical protein [Cellulomonas fimi]
MAIHPHTFSAALDDADVVQWQVNQESDGLRVILVARGADSPTARVQQRIARALHEAGADPALLSVERVDRIPRTLLGKTPLVRRLST